MALTHHLSVFAHTLLLLLSQMGTVAVFLQAYDDAPDYDVLNRLICAWREDEEKTREECGLDSILPGYPGCVHYTRGHDGTGARKLRQTNEGANERVLARTKALSAHDIILQNHQYMAANLTYDPFTIEHDPQEDLSYMDDFDWESFIAEQYEQDAAKERHHGRELLNYEHVGPWFNYFPMLAVRTEYYYRYSGTQTIPPCYGKWVSGSRRANTNHWRTMKDPIRVSHRQIAEMHRLLRERIAPIDDPVAACQPDTAAKVDKSTGAVNTARPLQSNHKAHFEVFCECENWGSKWAEDRKWCYEFRTQDEHVRFYEHPYNFYTNGF
jgi:Eukaryotic-type carbonic anhydrase